MKRITPVFAKAPEGSAGAGLPGGNKSAAATPEKNTITAVRTDIPIPVKVRKAGRGGSSPYPFDTLEIGGSFGVVGKSKKSIGSTVFGANKRNAENVMGADGQPLMKRVEKKDAAGNVTSKMVNVTKPLKLFEAFDVDPKTDPDGASVRVFRIALPAAPTA